MPFISLGARDTFVKVESCKGPVITGGDVVFIVLFLCIQTFELCISIGLVLISKPQELLLAITLADIGAERDKRSIDFI